MSIASKRDNSPFQPTEKRKKKKKLKKKKKGMGWGERPTTNPGRKSG